MTPLRRLALITAFGLSVATTGIRGGRAQFAGHPSAGQFSGGIGTGAGYGTTGYGSVSGISPLGYGIRNGAIGPGYQSAGGLYGQAYGAARPRTTVALQPLYSAITSLPGWSGGTRRVHRRVHRVQPSAPRTSPLDRDGKILWPSTIPNDPASSEARRAAEAAVRTVVRESTSTGHASIRPVIDAKNKLSALEHKILPEVKDKNVTDGNELEKFFSGLDRSLDAMTYVY
jgi:hypothetical protein